jgi:hypothetical protein
MRCAFNGAIDSGSALGLGSSSATVVKLSRCRKAKTPESCSNHFHPGDVRFVWWLQCRQDTVFLYMGSRVVALRVGCGVSVRETN